MAETTKEAPDKLPVYTVDPKGDFVPIQKDFAAITTRLDSGVYDPARIKWLQEQMKVEEDPYLRAARECARPALKFGHTDEACEIFVVTRDAWDIEIVKRCATTNQGQVPFIRALAKIGRVDEAKKIARDVARVQRPHATIFEATQWQSGYAANAVAEADQQILQRDKAVAFAHIIPHLNSFYRGKSEHFMKQMRNAVEAALKVESEFQVDVMLLQIVQVFAKAKRFDIAWHWLGKITDRITKAQGLISITTGSHSLGHLRELTTLLSNFIVHKGEPRVDCQAKFVHVQIALTQRNYGVAAALAEELSSGPYAVEAWSACYAAGQSLTSRSKAEEILESLKVDVDLGLTSLVIDRARLALVEALLSKCGPKEAESVACAIADDNTRSTAFLKMYCAKGAKRSLGP